MRPFAKRIVPAVATSGVLAALGITALPLLPVWLHHEAEPALSLPTQMSVQTAKSIQNDGEIVVDLRDSATDADVRDIDQRFGLDLKPNSIEASADRLYVADLPAGTDTDALLARLRTDGRVEAAEPELLYSIPEGTDNDLNLAQTVEPYTSLIAPSSAISIAYADDNASAAGPRVFNGALTPNDPRYNEQWNFQMIGVESAWNRTRGKGVVVAVIDTGVAGGNSKKGATARDFNQTKFVKGYDFVNKDEDAYDDQGHGTHVAGTIAESTNNNEGVAGIAFDATIMPVKVLSSSGSGTSAGVADGIRFAADHGANVINMSLGSPYPSTVIHNAVKYARNKGVVIVCAAGNGGGEGVGYPAAYPECIAVSSVGPTGQLARYSSYGKQVALAAPGGDKGENRIDADGILQNTVAPGGGDGYFSYQGTSMASPHVAAVAALIEAQGVTDPARVKDILLKTAKPNGDPNKYGAGILSAAQATAKAMGTSAVKLRHLLVIGLGFLFFAVGGPRRSRSLRLAMAGALTLGMFGPDWWASRVGADSAWNLLAFSAIVPMLFYAVARRGPAVKIAGSLALGTAVCLYANWHNETLPFTSATFGDAALPWTFANLGAALAVGAAASWRAFHATNRRA